MNSTRHNIIDLTGDTTKKDFEENEEVQRMSNDHNHRIQDDEEFFILEEEQRSMIEEQQRVDEEQRRVDEEQQRVDDEQRRVDEEQRRVDEEQRRVDEEQRRVDEEHSLEETRNRRIRDEEQLRHEAERMAQAAELLSVQLENERRRQVRLVANQITQASTARYIPCEKQIRCVTEERYTVQEALTIGGDHHTPCRECRRGELDECFWILNVVGLNVLGRQVRTGRQFQNKQVRFFLYQSFVDEEYDYLRDRRVNEVENIFEFRGGLPRFPLPFCVERDIKRYFPNEDGTPYVGFRRRTNRRGGRNSSGRNV